MQRSHSPTTWRHPKENDTMGSTYSCGNLAPWQVCGWGGVAIAEKGHLTLWLVMSGCQVGGSAKKGKKQWYFLFLKLEFKASFPYVFHTLTYLARQIKWGYYDYYHKNWRKRNWQVKQNSLTQHKKGPFLVPRCGGEIFSGWQHLQVKRLNWCFYIHKDNP